MAPLSFAPPAATSVEEAYKPAFEEIARRKAAAEAQADGVTYFARTDGAAHLPAAPPQQTWVLASMGTAVLAPVPADPARPALRVYGAFATKQDAAEHADVVRQLDPRCSLLLLERGAWALMPRTAATRDDPAENARRREAVLARHRGEQARDAAEFARVVKERADRPAPRPPPAEDDPDVADAEAAVSGAPRRLRAGGEVRGQAAMALSVVPDAGVCKPKVGQRVKSQFLYRNTPRMYRGVIQGVLSNDIIVRFTDNEVHAIPIDRYMEFEGEGEDFLAWMYEGDHMADHDMIKEVRLRAGAARLLELAQK